MQTSSTDSTPRYNFLITSAECRTCGLLAFDGVDDEVVFDEVPDVEGDVRITFKYYLRSSNGIGSMIYAHDSTGDGISISRNQGIINAFAGFAPWCVASDSGMAKLKWYDTIGEYEIEFIKSTRKAEILKVNDDESGPENYCLGNSNLSCFSIGSENNGYSFIENSCIYDIRIYDENDVLIHYWKGYPNGNTNAAWEDLVGNIDGTVYGSPGTVSF